MRIIISFYTVKPNSVISDRKLKKHGRGPCFLLFSEPDFDDVVFALARQPRQFGTEIDENAAFNIDRRMITVNHDYRRLNQNRLQ